MHREINIKEIFPQAKKVYDSLLDDQSKRFFSLRLLYNFTSDMSFIKEIVTDIDEFKNENLHPYIEFYIACKKHIADNRKIIIYGAGVWGKYLYETFSNGLKWHSFCDKDVDKQKSSFCNLPVISPEQLIQKHKDDIIVIGTKNYKEEVFHELVAMGIQSDHILTIPSDPYSVTHFLNEKQYFESSLIQSQENEVFIDAGCFDFANSLVFKEWCNGEYEKIIAFEPDPTNFKKCNEVIKITQTERVEMINAGLWSKTDTLHFNAEGNAGSTIGESGSNSVKVVSVDEVLDGERASFIKMDIEGAELEALIGAQNTIKTYRPRLAICIYHKPEDILEIPLYLQSLVPDYKFYIRHYSNYTIETVLYAV